MIPCYLFFMAEILTLEQVMQLMAIMMAQLYSVLFSQNNYNTHVGEQGLSKCRNMHGIPDIFT